MLIEDPVAPSGERVKILDFGIAKLTGNTPSTAQTAANAVLGSPRYMSPEQCAGAGGVDDKTDVYALGIILYEMLAGRRPFESQGVGELFLFHMTKEPDPLQVIAPSVPGEVARLVHKLLVKDKTLRPTMKQVQSELSNLLMSLSGSSFTVRRRASGAMAMADMRPSVRSSGGIHTTLGESLGPSLRAASQSRTHLSILAVCAALVSVSLVFVLLRTGAKDRSEPKKVETTSQSPVSKLPVVVPAESQPAGQVTRVRWSIESEPSGAELVDESGAKLGQTPWKSEREGKPGALKIIVRKRGYEVSSVTLPHDRDVSQLVKLVVPTKTIASKKKQKKQGKGLEIED
jgi:serine/threonine-protein kinase